MKIKKYLDASPLFALYRSTDVIFQDFNRRLRKEDLNFLQALTLLALFFEDKPIQPSMLASSFKTTRGNVSHHITYLEKQKLVLRNTSEKDARHYLISLTATGKKRALQLIKLFDGIQNHLEDHFTEPKVLKINASILRIADLYTEYRNEI